MRTPLPLDLLADADPDRIIVGPAVGGLSAAALRDRAHAAAGLLADSGAKHALFVGINGPEMPVTLFGSGIAGLPFVPLNYRLPDADLRRLAARTSPALAIVDDDMAARLDGVEGVTVMRRSAFAAAIAGPGERRDEADGDIAVLLFTSGTTGEPKAAVLRHANLTSYVLSTVDFLGSGDDEAALVSVPPYHIAGISAVLTGVYSGRRIVYLPSFEAEAWVDLATAERVTHAMLVPTMLARILDVLDARGTELPVLRALSYGGGRMPEPVIARALARLPQVDFVNAYGLTETSSTIALLGADDHRAAFAADDPAARRRLASVGRPLPSVEIEIRAEDGRVCAPDEPGEIHVRGDQVAGEYLHKRLLSDDGWFATNDAGWMDEAGYLYVDGRLDDVIVRGGENISPGEIEDVLRSHGAVADVAVLGLPDRQWGEKVAAVVVLREPCETAALGDFVRTRLRSTKTPETWVVRDALPYNDTGKLLRRQLRAELAEA